MPMSRRKLLISALAGAFIGMGGYTFYFARGTSYLSNDPAACVNCHVMREQYEGWLRSAHHAVATCNDCHTPHNLVGKYLTKAENGYHHSKAFTLGNYHEPIMIREKNARILNRACLHCHGDFVGPITAHMGPGEDVNACTRCHADVGHGAN